MGAEGLTARAGVDERRAPARAPFSHSSSEREPTSRRAKETMKQGEARKRLKAGLPSQKTTTMKRKKVKKIQNWVAAISSAGIMVAKKQ